MSKTEADSAYTTRKEIEDLDEKLDKDLCTKIKKEHKELEIKIKESDSL